jgi:hypothetical protein
MHDDLIDEPGHPFLASRRNLRRAVTRFPIMDSQTGGKALYGNTFSERAKLKTGDA